MHLLAEALLSIFLTVLTLFEHSDISLQHGRDAKACVGGAKQPVLVCVGEYKFFA
jgi:hypothetical protein